ncbi:putative aromatic peroxygenase [Podospora australis]|uniref:Aromatic peroxygenase n=1 Tax=Podospora australis TaxID=1536484 RepID=A0AAN7AKT9_9PEZI|nr:putative aromatic peroxygenase [Podospora australis]
MASRAVLKVTSVISHVFDGLYNAVKTLTGGNKVKDAADHSFQKPSPADRRSPCPMVNALANHGYLPRDGKDVSLAKLIKGFKEAINLAPDATLLVGIRALQLSSTGSLFTFHLDDLNKHGAIEHDGSLSRKDAFFGDNHTFSPETWAQVSAHFGDREIIPIEVAAEARKARLAKAAEENPDFKLPSDQEGFSYIETSLYLYVFGGLEGNAKTEWVRVLMEQDRLPLEEGFRRSDKLLTISDILTMKAKVQAASS